MLRSLYSGISGLRSHQTMLDITGNNIANVNTTAFKSSAVQFQDTLSQLVQGAGRPAAATGGTNPAQVGLGVQVAGITTNVTQGSAQMTGRGTDMMIDGDGYFVLRRGDEVLYSRAGSFDFDASGRLVSPDGALVQGWTAVGGTIPAGGPTAPITLPLNAVAGAVMTTTAGFGGNLPDDAAVGTTLTREIEVFDAAGAGRMLTATFTRAAGQWDVSIDDGSGAVTGALTFAGGVLTSSPALTVGGVSVDLTTLTGYAGPTTVSASGQDGRDAGTLQSFSLGRDGSIIGSFSNGSTQVLAQLALANFVNPVGLEKAGASSYRATVNSGQAQLGTAGSAGLGSIIGSSLEMSNVDLSQEFTNLIVAQRGFQANARIITTSDEVLQELTNLKR